MRHPIAMSLAAFAAIALLPAAAAAQTGGSQPRVLPWKRQPSPPQPSAPLFPPASEPPRTFLPPDATPAQRLERIEQAIARAENLDQRVDSGDLLLPVDEVISGKMVRFLVPVPKDGIDFVLDTMLTPEAIGPKDRDLYRAHLAKRSKEMAYYNRQIMYRLMEVRTSTLAEIEEARRDRGRAAMGPAAPAGTTAERFGIPPEVAAHAVKREELRSEECWHSGPVRTLETCSFIQLSIWVYTLDNGGTYWDRKEYDAKRAQMQQSGYTFGFSRALPQGK